jgi:hypothetical protein
MSALTDGKRASDPLSPNFHDVVGRRAVAGVRGGHICVGDPRTVGRVERGTSHPGPPGLALADRSALNPS